MKNSQKSGFTIIEVVLVLAIGGLILAMGMLAFSHLSLTQRDSARRENILKVISAIKDYQTNHRGALPSGDGDTWGRAIGLYLDDNFVDPDGGHYVYKVEQCESNDGCLIEESFAGDNHTIHIYTKSACDGERAIPAANPKKVAVLYRLENAGVYCENT